MTAKLRQQFTAYPAVVLLGPRQVGKTTLAKSLGGRYFDLEQPGERVRLDATWDEAMAASDLLILDEAQTWPELFARLRGAIDQDRQRRGRFLLLGSVSPHLLRQVSESLAGRVALLHLSPFMWPEVATHCTLDQHWFYGGFADGGLLEPVRFPDWQHFYWETLARRDLPDWGFPAAPATTMRFVHMLAATHGQEWNASRMGQSLGLNAHTVASYLDFLEGVFLVRRLPAYAANIRKRLVKRPKVYMRDSGLLHGLFPTVRPATIWEQPWVGASWEGYAIGQILDLAAILAPWASPYYLRTSDQYEIDLLLDVGPAGLWAIEIKLTSEPTPAMMARLTHTADLVGATKRILLTRAATPVINTAGTQIVCDLEWLLGYLREQWMTTG